MKQFAFRALVAFGVMTGAAFAGEERSCAAQYALEDHLLLEWAALGGDPHAQMSIAQCAFPIGADTEAMTAAEKTYAIRWTTIALCDATPSAAHDRRDLRLRKLKEDASISFRRFGGLSKKEKLNWREREFMEYRKEQNALLAERHQKLLASVTPADLGKARGELAEQLSRMGPAGLLKLAELTSCDAFGASAEFEAAAWSAASESWSGSEVAGVYAAADDEDHDLPRIAKDKTKALSGADRRVAAIEKDRLLRTDPRRIAALEQKVSRFEETRSLDRLANFSIPDESGGAGIAETVLANEPKLTLALQFALESLGYVNFISGPDNDYGPTTRDAVARLKVSEGELPTPNLSNAETRSAICRAALKGDPVSLYHVALMYQNGWGFPTDRDRAAAAIRRAETAMIASLGGDDLPAWKRDAYQAYAGKIRGLAGDLKKPDVDADAGVCD